MKKRDYRVTSCIGFLNVGFCWLYNPWYRWGRYQTAVSKTGTAPDGSEVAIEKATLKFIKDYEAGKISTAFNRRT
jgi:hypothetical protein